MTPKQTKYYWRAWAAAHRADPAADRHELTLRALGKNVSSKDLTNRQFDAVLAAFAAVAQPNSVDAQMRQAGMARTRALHTIRKAPAAYVQKLCADRFGTRDFETLSDKDLATLAMTLNNRKNAKKPPEQPNNSPSPSAEGDLSRLGIGERNAAELQAPCGPSAGDGASHRRGEGSGSAVSAPSPAHAGEGRGEGANSSLPESDSSPVSLVSDDDLADAEAALQADNYTRPNYAPKIPKENCPY